MQQHAEVAAGVDVIRFERDDGFEFGHGQIGLVLSQIFLRLAAVFFDLLLVPRSGLRKAGIGGKQEHSEDGNTTFFYPHVASIRRANSLSWFGVNEKKYDGEVPPSSPSTRD